MRAKYTLKVMHPGEAFPTETVTLGTSAEVTETIPRLLAKHAGCHRIHVHAGHARLFSVDCHGHTVQAE
ncbi:hypothetical protein GGQ87_002440 [Brevundimonas alba]|uniref:Uncharacterized protein n=1 Tax=Brevundimonas alba TaxID=74314 RepID=A0A7X5YP47_9CAUL|nr:hypothetical protein [Brevundimonas alba]